jgi:hypothetical protein
MYSAGMRGALKLHPSSSCAAVNRIEVQVTRHEPRHLILHYYVSGQTDGLRFAPASQPARADKLWQRCCFEAFVSASPGEAYCEFNFAPSLKWAAYSFESYRSKMREILEIAPPRIEASLAKTSYRMHVALELEGLSVLPADVTWHVGLSAVIEETSGRMSYWALAHPPGEADLHHVNCFALKLHPRISA